MVVVTTTLLTLMPFVGWCLAFGVRYLVLSAWCLMFDALSFEFGACCLPTVQQTLQHFDIRRPEVSKKTAINLSVM